MNELLANSLTLDELANRLLDHEDPAVKVFAKKFLEDYGDDLESDLEEFVSEKVSELLSDVENTWSRAIAKDVSEWLTSR